MIRGRPDVVNESIDGLPDPPIELSRAGFLAWRVL